MEWDGSLRRWDLAWRNLRRWLLRRLLLRSPSTLAEVDAHRLAGGGFLRLEIGLGFEVEHSREDAAGKLLAGVVVLQDLVVIELTRVGDASLGAGELLLEREEVLVGLQVGVGLGHREQLTKCAGQ